MHIEVDGVVKTIFLSFLDAVPGEEKAGQYEAAGTRYFRTDEEEIRNLSATVDRLQSQFMDFVEMRYGPERATMIGEIEEVRRQADIAIGRSIGEFENGLFEMEDSPEGVVAVWIPQLVREPVDATQRYEDQPQPLIPGLGPVQWQEETFGQMNVMIARRAEQPENAP